MIWVLIVISRWGTDMQEFNTQQSCETARKQIEERFAGWANPQTFCVKK